MHLILCPRSLIFFLITTMYSRLSGHSITCSSISPQRISGYLATPSHILLYLHKAHPVVWPPRLIFYYISTKHIQLSGHPVSYFPYQHKICPVVWPPNHVFFHITTTHIRLSGHPVSYSTISPQSTSGCLATPSHILLYLHKAHPVVWPPSLIFYYISTKHIRLSGHRVSYFPYQHKVCPVVWPPNYVFFHITTAHIRFSVHPVSYISTKHIRLSG